MAGHRRHAAAALAEQTDVPCITRTMTDGERLAAMLVENLHRTDLDPLEEARGYAQLRTLGWAQTRIATQVGRDQGTISRRLRLLDLVPAAIEQVRAGHLSLDTATKLARLEPKAQTALLKKHAGSSWLDQGIAGDIDRQRQDERELRARRSAHGDLIDAGIEVLTDPETPTDRWSLEHQLTPRGALPYEAAVKGGGSLKHAALDA